MFLWVCVMIAGLSISGIGFASGDVCLYQECDCQGSYIECQSRNLTSVPKLVSNNTNNTVFTILVLDANRLTKIVSGSLPPNLREISLTLNPIASIDDDAFNQSATTLETLRFDGAHFTRIPDAFLHLHNLKNLYIYNTPIRDWNPNAMRNIGNTIETLFLGSVGLTSWPDWFHDFAHFYNVYLADSSFTSVPDNAFAMSENTLVTLSIINGRLMAVPKSLANHTALKSIHLQDNQITDLTWLPHLSNVSDIDLNFNNISDAGMLSYVLRPYANSLKNLGLVGNQLTVIPDLSYLTQIGSLDFGRNRLSDPNSGVMPSNVYALSFAFNWLPSIPRVYRHLTGVTELFMPSNLVTQIQGSDFLPLIMFVLLENNLISELTDDSFPLNSSIISVNLNNNPIVKISAQALSSIPRLRELRLQQSKLTRLPLFLASLNHIFVFDISNSTDLVCTCEEKSLQMWILSLPPEDVLGNCGDTSVYNFFTTLSQSCPTQ
ncbi:unnamed protein product [Candidula unifasciata]|uniref:Uncharacterized protein n=1 Tax=Candidula unifasciata TaxID=100452 RepID=A0A8S3Z5A2_9EUPU|nr:unnamed protein product [Candidula unifasciata]